MGERWLAEFLGQLLAVADGATHKEALTETEALVLRIVEKRRVQLQKLFDRYNLKYWDGMLPQYRIVISGKYGGAGYCDTRNHLIFIHPNVAWEPKEARATLLHEMAHGFTSANGHGERWQYEMRRLGRLGAPVDSADLNPQKGESSFETIRQSFEDAGFDAPQASWPQARRTLGYELGLVTRNGRAVNAHIAHLLRGCREVFSGASENAFLFDVRGSPYLV